MINESNIASLITEAQKAGQIALQTAIPKAMLVDNRYLVEGGVCGFAWVNIYGIRSNSKLGKTLDTLGFRKNSYEKAHQFWVFDGGQSMQRKEAYAFAMAKVLRDAGLRAYADSRMD